MTAKEATLANGNFNVAQSLEQLIKQAVEDTLNIDIPTPENWQNTVKYSEPDSEDPVPRPVLNSLNNPINPDHIKIKTRTDAKGQA